MSLEVVPRPAPHGAVVEELQRPDAVRQLAVQEHVVVDGHARHEGEVLEDGVDPERASVRHGLELHLLAEDEDLAGVGLVKAGQDLDQRRLAGAVVADQPEHLARSEVERDVLERCHHTEALADVLDADRVGQPSLVRDRGAESRFRSCRAPQPSRLPDSLEGHVERHRGDDGDTEDEVERVGTDPLQREAEVQHGENEHAERGADDGA